MPFAPFAMAAILQGRVLLPCHQDAIFAHPSALLELPMGACVDKVEEPLLHRVVTNILGRQLMQL
jgi:hypothetical protein